MTEQWRICKETGKKFNSFRGFLNHLRTIKMSSKEYYDKHFKKENEGICYCGNMTNYYSFSYKKYCSDVCWCKSNEHRNNIKNKFINNPSALDSFRKKIKENKVDNNIDKRRKTIREKCRKLNITENQYYSEHSKKSAMSISSEKRKNMTLKAMSTKEKTDNFGGKSTYKKVKFFDEYVLLQGYEQIVLKSLIEDFNLGKNDILIGKSNVPIIRYKDNLKERMYFPDFFLPNKNLLIEVKSLFTLKNNIENVYLKCKYSLKNGYSILLIVVDVQEARNGKLDSSKKLLDWAISSQSPKPTWYGEGSTTILNGVESSDSKNNPSIFG